MIIHLIVLRVLLNLNKHSDNKGAQKNLQVIAQISYHIHKSERFANHEIH